MKKVEEKLEELGRKVLEQLEKGRDPYIKITQRSLGNVSYDKDKGFLVIGNKYSKRYYLNIAHTRKFMQTLLVASYCNELIKENKHAGIRELYYALKHTIEGTKKENTFENQDESNPIIEDLELSLNVLREELNLTADRRGYLYGDIVIKDGEDEFNCSKLGRGGWAVPGNVEEIEFKRVNARYILVVETAAMADRLIEEKFAQKNKALIVACQGQAPRGVRRLIKRIHKEKKLPVIVFTDGDPYGWYIYSTIKQGSINLAYLSNRLSVPDSKFVGMTIDDIETYGLENVTEKLKETDLKRIKEELEYPWFKTKEWQRQLKLALKKGVRIEQQALANKSLSFVADKYLPEKIENEIFLS
ncbi:MAG: DNA topoisomerase IV subunit A [Methanomicrobia archaeon]|nr:DNA topoisomerase IV subunit A [Methanomicrobia archaeon]